MPVIAVLIPVLVPLLMLGALLALGRYEEVMLPPPKEKGLPQ